MESFACSFRARCVNNLRAKCIPSEWKIGIILQTMQTGSAVSLFTRAEDMRDMCKYRYMCIYVFQQMQMNIQKRAQHA